MSDPYRAGRRDPTPVSRGGELTLLALAGALLLAALAAVTGLGIASAVVGGGWVWPHGTDQTRATLAGLLGGDPVRGLPSAVAARVPSAGAVYTAVAVCEAAAVALAVAVTVLVLRWSRPSDPRRGLASAAEARRVVGTRRLRCARHLIRPDLYPPRQPRRVTPQLRRWVTRRRTVTEQGRAASSGAEEGESS